MARITLSIDDAVAASLDAYAKAHNLNRSQAAEDIFQGFFAANGEQVGPMDADTRAIAEIREYLVVFHSALAGFTDELPVPPWSTTPATS